MLKTEPVKLEEILEQVLENNTVKQSAYLNFVIHLLESSNFGTYKILDGTHEEVFFINSYLRQLKQLSLDSCALHIVNLKSKDIKNFEKNDQLIIIPFALKITSSQYLNKFGKYLIATYYLIWLNIYRRADNLPQIIFMMAEIFNQWHLVKNKSHVINGIKKGYQTILRNDQLFESLDTITCEVITKNRDRLWDKANREFIIRGLSELNNIIKEIGELHLEHVRNYHLNTPQEKNKSIKRKPDRSFPYINENTGDFFESFTAYLNNVNPKNRAQENEIKYALLQYVRVHREL